MNRSVIKLKNNIKVVSSATVGGKKEKEGPLGQYIDIYFDGKMGEQTWEKAESEMCRLALNTALSKAQLYEQDIDILLAGDLINQCTSTGYGLSSFDIPYFGLYGACSTFAQGVMIGSLLLESGQFKRCAVVVSSQFCTAERQFRYPLDYGAFAENTAQNTVTAAGAVILEKTNEKTGIFVTECLPGIVCDAGIKDASNMGAAMAPAAADTIIRYIGNDKALTNTDEIATGDLGFEGREILLEKLQNNNINNKEKILDCGMLIYDLTRQSVGCGGSGCGCSAFCACGYYMDKLERQEIKSLALIGTGAMMSPQNILQGDSIPAIAHLVKFEVK